MKRSNQEHQEYLHRAFELPRTASKAERRNEPPRLPDAAEVLRAIAEEALENMAPKLF